MQWKEYYDLTRDPWELDNLLYDKNSKSLTMPPDVAAIAVRLHRAATCAGRSGANPCP